MPQLDHIILAVNDMKKSIAFYTDILGLKYDGEREPFSVVRVTPHFTLQLAPWGTKGGEHLAFSMTRAEFDATFARIKAVGLEYGDSFHAVGNFWNAVPYLSRSGLRTTIVQHNRHGRMARRLHLLQPNPRGAQAVAHLKAIRERFHLVMISIVFLPGVGDGHGMVSHNLPQLWPF